MCQSKYGVRVFAKVLDLLARGCLPVCVPNSACVCMCVYMYMRESACMCICEVQQRFVGSQEREKERDTHTK